MVQYFKGIGYEVPMFVDIADFLQELPTAEGARFINTNFRRTISSDNLAASVSAKAAGLKVSVLMYFMDTATYMNIYAYYEYMYTYEYVCNCMYLWMHIPQV